eukprot:jgi/Mesvir1/10905/Mv22755-RA.1
MAKLIESISKGLNALRGVIRLARQCLKAVKLGTAAIAAAAQGPALLAGGGSGVMLSASLGLAGTLPLIGGSVASFIKMYLLLLFLRVLLTWFPNIECFEVRWLVDQYPPKVVQYVEGSARFDVDLRRVGAQDASAVFILANVHASDRDAEDGLQILRYQSLRQFCGPGLRIVMQLLQPENADPAMFADGDTQVREGGHRNP